MSETDTLAGQGRDTTSVPTETITPRFNHAQTAIIGAVIVGAVLIATLGFIGSYQAVADLAKQKNFGSFAEAFPIAVDAGIGVLLALDLLLTWLRIPYPVLRHAAWVLTGGTIAFNAASSWGDEIAVCMHAAIPALFVLIVEAARHAIGRLADITADRHIENPPLIRWFISPHTTYRIWWRMRMWNLTSYTAVVRIEREAVEFRTRLRCRHGWRWRTKAQSVELLALKLARFGTPVHQTLASVELEPAAAEVPELVSEVELPAVNLQVPEPAPRWNLCSGSLNLLPPVPRTDRNQVPGTTKSAAESRTPRTRNQVGDRAAKRTAQIDEVLNLMKELGYDAVNLAEVQSRTGMSKTTAYHRLTDARAEWNQRAA